MKAGRAHLARARARRRGPVGHLRPAGARRSRSRSPRRPLVAVRMVGADGTRGAARYALAGPRAPAARRARRRHAAEGQAAALREERPRPHHGLARHAGLVGAAPAARLRARAARLRDDQPQPRAARRAHAARADREQPRRDRRHRCAQADDARPGERPRRRSRELAEAPAALAAGVGGERRRSSSGRPISSRCSARPSTARRRTIWPRRCPISRRMRRSSAPAPPTA